MKIQFYELDLRRQLISTTNLHCQVAAKIKIHLQTTLRSQWHT